MITNVQIISIMHYIIVSMYDFVHEKIYVPHLYYCINIFVGDDHLGIMIQRSTGNFEVFIQDNSSDSVRPIVKGKISVLVKIEGEVLSSGFDAEGAQIVSEDSTVVSEEEFYNCFESKGYQLSSYFKHLKEIKVIDNG